MNVVTNKAIVIAIGIFITVAITSAILITIDQMREVYSDVYETDITISSGFQEFDQYDGTEKTGLDLLNALNKYFNNSSVKINVGSFTNVNNRTQDYINNNYDRQDRYTWVYDCTIKQNNDVTTITFTKK